MPKVLCCNHKQSCRLYYLKPGENFKLSLLYWLDSCSICGHCVLYMQRLDYDNNFSSFRKSNLKARALFDKLKNQIDFEYKPAAFVKDKKIFYLNYNDFGTIRKCYSNFSSLKIGRFSGIGIPLPSLSADKF